MNYCTRHGRYRCGFTLCRNEARALGSTSVADNFGGLAYDASSGDLAIGIGGGLAIDTANGDLAIDVGGIAFDL